MSSYSEPVGHASMVFDHIRNAAYEQAILAKVHKDSVVLDLGAGLGVHGLMAAKAGARKVYLVDPSPAVLVAKKVAEANGLDNVVCIQSSAEQMELDEKVDMIISVFTGNFLLTEDLLPSLFAARDKYLKPGGCLIPERAKMMVMPVSMPQGYKNYVSKWDRSEDESIFKRFGLDYSVLAGYARNSLFYDDFNKQEWTSIAASAELTDIDFNTATKAESFGEIQVKAEVDLEFHGWLGWFDMLLGETWLSTSPESEKLHWSQVYLPVESVEACQAGQTLRLELKRPEYGDWTWRSVPGSKVNQSTFLSRPVSVKDIPKQSPAYKPKLSDDGEVLLYVMSCFVGEQTVENIAMTLLERFPAKFPDKDKAERYVQAQARVFS